MTESELYKSFGESIAETDTNRVVRIHCLVAIRAALFLLTFATVFTSLFLPHHRHPLLFLETGSFIESGQDTLAGGNQMEHTMPYGIGQFFLQRYCFY